MRKKSKSTLESLTAADVEQITRKSRRNKNIPLVISKQTPITLDAELGAKVEVLSSAQGVPPSIFVSALLKKDVDRLWKTIRKLGNR